MSDENKCMVISLGDYEFVLDDVNEPDGVSRCKGKMEVSYDGEFLGIDTWEIAADKEFTSHTPMQSITLVGHNQANLLVGAILALLSAYGDPTYLDDEDIQKEFKYMDEETKNAYAEETVASIQG